MKPLAEAYEELARELRGAARQLRHIRKTESWSVGISQLSAESARISAIGTAAASASPARITRALRAVAHRRTMRGYRFFATHNMPHCAQILKPSESTLVTSEVQS
jgi:hypothetical protein